MILPVEGVTTVLVRNGEADIFMRRTNGDCPDVSVATTSHFSACAGMNTRVINAYRPVSWRGSSSCILNQSLLACAIGPISISGFVSGSSGTLACVTVLRWRDEMLLVEKDVDTACALFAVDIVVFKLVRQSRAKTTKEKGGSKIRIVLWTAVTRWCPSQRQMKRACGMIEDWCNVDDLWLFDGRWMPIA